MSDRTPREEAIVQLAAGRSSRYVAIDLEVPEEAVRRLGGLLGWPGDTRQLKRAAAAIRAGERLWAGELTERPADVEPVGQAQPAPEATDDEPAGCSDECGGCSCHLGNSAPCNHCTDNHDGIDDEPMPLAVALKHAPQPLRCVVCGGLADPFAPWSEGRKPMCAPCVAPPAVVPAPITDQGDPMPTPTDEADELAVLADVEKLTTSTDRATLTMPLTRLVDLDGTETVLAEVVVEVQIVPEHVLVLLMETEGMVPASPVTAYVSRRLTTDGETAIRALAALLPSDGDR